VLTLPVAVFPLLRDGEDRAEPVAPSTSTSPSPDTTASTAPARPAAPDGHIPLAVLGDATLGDYQRCCDDQTPQKWQRRGYRPADDRFSQSGPVTTSPLSR
jgi:hypothetical protein